MIAERFSRSFFPGHDSPCDSIGRSEKPERTLITEEPWDCYHLESLLPLKETYRENTEFGFLLRHYWIPATILSLGSRSERRSRTERRIGSNWKSSARWHVAGRTNVFGARRFVLLRGRTETAGFPFDRDALLLRSLRADVCFRQADHVCAARYPTRRRTARRRGPPSFAGALSAGAGADRLCLVRQGGRRLHELPLGCRGADRRDFGIVDSGEGRYTSWLSEEPATPGGETKTVAVVVRREGVAVRLESRGITGGSLRGSRFGSRGRIGFHRGDDDSSCDAFDSLVSRGFGETCPLCRRERAALSRSNGA